VSLFVGIGGLEEDVEIGVGGEFGVEDAGSGGEGES
jgi:hypothetical protein